MIVSAYYPGMYDLYWRSYCSCSGGGVDAPEINAGGVDVIAGGAGGDVVGGGDISDINVEVGADKDGVNARAEVSGNNVKVELSGSTGPNNKIDGKATAVWSADVGGGTTVSASASESWGHVDGEGVDASGHAAVRLGNQNSYFSVKSNSYLLVESTSGSSHPAVTLGIEVSRDLVEGSSQYGTMFGNVAASGALGDNNNGKFSLTVGYKLEFPVVLDLDGDGVELIDSQVSGVYWDGDGDGFSAGVGWAAADDGFLTYDKNGDGRITSYDEISFVGYLPGAQTDLAGCGKTASPAPFPHSPKPPKRVGAGLRAAFAATLPGFRRFEAESGHGHAAAISFGSLTRL